jgi:Apea-like HEPN
MTTKTKATPRKAVQKLLYAFCREALAHLKQHYDSGKHVPLRDGIKVKYFKEGGAGALYDKYIDTSALARQEAQVLIKLPSYASAHAALESDTLMQGHWNKEVQTEGWGGVLTAQGTMIEMAASVFERFGEKKLTAKAFQSTFRHLVRYFDGATIEALVPVPLYGLLCDMSSVDLGRGLTLVWLDDLGQNFIAGTIGARRFSRQRSSSSIARHALLTRVQVEKVIGYRKEPPKKPSPVYTASEHMDMACTALRLFRGGTVLAPTMVVAHEPVPFVTSVGHVLQAPAGFHHPSSFQLTGAATTEFVAFWHAYRNYEHAKFKSVSAATMRFNFGYERVRIEDRIIDYVVALEAILLEGGMGLTYKLALRGAALIGKGSDDRQKVRERLKSAYVCRSNLVHGESLNKALKEAKVTGDPDLFVEQLEDDVRRVIRDFLDLSVKDGEAKALDQIEHRIISGEYPS